MKKILPIIAISMLITACSGNQKANENNFKQAIRKYETQHPLCLAMPLAVDNENIFLGQPIIRIEHSKTLDKNTIRQMEVLNKADIYKKQKSEKINGNHVSVYKLTDKGAKYADKTRPLLCVANLNVERIKWFSQPTADNGLYVSHVSFSGKYKLHSWADKLLKINNDDTYKLLQQPVDAQTVLVLTNKGWIDNREVSK